MLLGIKRIKVSRPAITKKKKRRKILCTHNLTMNSSWHKIEAAHQFENSVLLTQHAKWSLVSTG